MRSLVAVLALATAAAGAEPPAKAPTLYIEAGMVIPVEGKPIAGGKIVVKDGKVSDVGADVARPPFSVLVDAQRFTVTPGFVVPYSSIGLPAVETQPSADGSVRVAMNASTKAADELYPARREYALLLQQGITTLGLVPGAEEVGVVGMASAISTRAGKASDMTLAAEAALVVNVATHGPWRKTVGTAFDEARKGVIGEERKEAAREKARAAGKRRDDVGARKAKQGVASDAKSGKGGDGKGDDKSKDPLARALKKKLPVIVVPRMPAGWVAASDTLPLARMQVSVLDSPTLYQVAADLASAKVRVLTWPALVRVPRTRFPLNRAAEYEKAGVAYAFVLPADSVRGAVLLRDAVIEMARTGCSREKVLAALTLEPAKALGLEATVGSVQSGRRADLLFWSGDPLEPVSRLEAVMVGGEIVEPLPEARLDVAEGSP
jgi:imidazolonepropionase-like amidohydrolase